MASPRLASPRSPYRHRTFACEECSRRKHRCDKVLPVCNPCRKQGLACSQSQREKNLVQTRDNSVTRKGYVRLLEEKVALLESQARQRCLIPALNEVEYAGDDATMDLDEGHHLGQQGEDDASWPLQGANMNMNTLSLSAMAEPRTRAGEFLKELAMPSIIAGMTETYGGNPEITSRLDSLWDGIARDIRHPENADSHRLRLDRDEALHFLSTYLDMVDFRFPKLQVDKVRSGIDAITAMKDETYTAALATNPSHIFMAYMLAAIVPLVSDGYPISHGSFVSTHVMAKCLRVLDRVFRHEDGVDIIQCLHLLVVFAIHSSAAGSSWHLIGFAMDKCIALGYHREGGPTPGVSEDEIQQRRWVFWSCYHLDALISGALDRPMSIDDRYVTVSLPGELEESPMPAISMSNVDRRHAHLYQYARLMASILKDSESISFSHHLSRLLHWRAMAPTRSTPGLDKAYAHETSLFNTLMLRAAIQQIGSFAERRYHSMTPQDYLRSQQAEAREVRLLDICRGVVKSLDRHTMIGRPYLSMTTGYSAFSVGLAALYYASCMTKDDSAGIEVTRELVESAMRKLDVVSRQFPRMQDYHNLIDKLRKRLIHFWSGGEGPEEAAERQVEDMVSGIGPGHVKRLARGVICCQDVRFRRPQTCVA